MTEQTKTRRTKVLCRTNIWLENSQARPVKVPAGMAVLLDADEIKHFGRHVTKDVPDEVELYDRP